MYWHVTWRCAPPGGRGGVPDSSSPHVWIFFKTQVLYARGYRTFCVIYSSVEISQWNRLMTSYIGSYFAAWMISARLTLGWHYVIRRVSGGLTVGEAGGLTVGEGSEKKDSLWEQHLESPTKTHQRYSRCWECCPPDRMQVTLWNSCPETKHQFFSSWRGSSWTTPGFSALQYRMFLEFTSPRNENQASLQKNTKCGSTSSYTDWRNKLQKCILATESYTFKVWTTAVLHGRSCNYVFCGPSSRRFPNTRLLRWEIFCDICRKNHTWNTAALTTRAVQQCIWVEACCYVNEGQQCIY